MSTLELQNKIIRKIREINDEDVLESLFRMVRNEKSSPYKLTAFEQQFIKESLEDYQAGKVISNKEVFDQTDKWLKE